MIEARFLTEYRDFSEAVQLQKLIWGWDEIELIPLRLFIVASRIGGMVHGAFDGGEMVAFSLAIPALKPAGKAYLYSHMLGVKKEYRNAGVGRLLKLEQRKEALARNIDLLEWTFDPLEVKNAYFNIERLGAVVRRFVPNLYGTTSSPLHAGLPTDRCIAEWWLAHPRAEARLVAREAKLPPAIARIAVPADIGTIKQTDQARAREIQKRVCDQFQEYFSKNLTVIGFERTAEAGTYLLAPWDPSN